MPIRAHTQSPGPGEQPQPLQPCQVLPLCLSCVFSGPGPARMQASLFTTTAGASPLCDMTRRSCCQAASPLFQPCPLCPP
ncbi:hypothetical protein Pmani_004072 [Petrolisthes manimaculis]|uniref:Uncharacterized protein n=1 Tax=Petrolisthes manimaculis TaxID=1843537 RepID=A0AAE1QFF5_9EUCA|nr:hypothetical protein Pmani_004072 [Petrolisthes manimaculis]